MQTAFTECRSMPRWLHLQPELLIVELLDEMNKPATAGQPGEVTITTLGVEGMPLLRYKTGDICVYDDTPLVPAEETHSGYLPLLVVRNR